MTSIVTKRLLTLVLLVAIVAPGAAALAPRPAHAVFGIGDIVLDPTNLIQTTATAIASVGLNTKEFVLDPIAWIVAKAAIASLTKSTVNWINSGFQGSPAFVTDLRANLLKVSDAVAGQFFDELAGNIINSPYGDEIATAVRTGYYLSTGGQFYVQNPFTLDQYSSDPTAFLNGDFSQGGFSAFFSTIVNQQNNPYGAYQLAAGELDRRLATAGTRRVTELNWGQGFMGFRDCTDDIDGSDAVALAETDTCLQETIKTPGTVIAARLNQSLGASQDSLVTADEIDEVLGALFTQLTTKVLGSGGLIGVSAPSSGGGRPYIDQAATKQSTTGSSQQSTVTEAQLLGYQANWQKISTVAEDAISRCSTSSLAQSAANSATGALAKASNALSILDSAGQSSTAYGYAAPTQQEVTQAQLSAADSGNSLYVQLTQVSSCN
ncbi:MAG: hypothetical protein AAB901_00620 [Patescibacteria group bacterium]